MFDLYRNSLKDVIDSNIDDRLPGRNNYLRPSKPSAPALWLGKAVLLLFEHLGNSRRTTSSKRNNSRLLPIGNLSSRLAPNSVPQDLLNPLLKSNDRRLWKTKKSVRLVYGDLVNSSYSTRQSASTLFQGSLAVSKNNFEGMGNFKGNLMLENSKFDKLQKSSMELVIPYGKSKQERFWICNLVEKYLIMVGNWLLL